jgi:TPR repeat protein
MRPLLIILILSLPMSGSAAGQAPQTLCDLLATHPSDTQKAASGVEQEDFDIPAAREACANALAQYPTEGRFAYQYGRSFFYDDEYEAALPYFEQAARSGHAQGQLVLGLVLMGGYAGDPDTCAAGRWWLAAARQTHLYSKIYLLQNWTDGLFEDCNLDLTEAEANIMVEAAVKLASTPQARDDVAQLQDSWAQR